MIGARGVVGTGSLCSLLISVTFTLACGSSGGGRLAHRDAGEVGDGGPSGGDGGSSGGGNGGRSGSGNGGRTSGNGGTPSGLVNTKKLDVVLMVDNSSSMADKQRIFATALPDLVQALTAVEDLHVAVITSSLGGHGASICEQNEAQDDHGELLGSRPRGAGLANAQGFVEWTPSQSGSELGTKIQNLVLAAGQVGCGLEAQLESVYRFLADPFPPQSIALQACRGGAQCATPVGVDSTILSQRAAFLRPDSAVAVVLLTDENDCSIRDSDQYYYAASVDVLLPAASAACAANPNDPCCYSCALAPPPGCTPDPACGSPPRTLTSTSDPPNLRCFENKRRFGIDFLYPTARYVNALKRPTLCTTSADLDASGTCPARPDGSPGTVTNPLYAGGAQGRDPSMVYLLGIVGVPWQLVAADPNAGELHYKATTTMTGDGTWSKILGDANPDSGAPPVLPSDPHMQESIDPRPGLPGPNTPPTADPINGHEWNISNRNELEFACIFPLPTPGPCTDVSCDCYQPTAGENNPLCANPAGAYEQVQYKAKAYPGLRELDVIEAMGASGVVASICARNLTDPSKQDFGYGPAIDALATALSNSVK